MRIIVQGKLPENKLYVYTCLNCSTKFEFAKSEATEDKSIFDQSKSGLEINCPFCGYKCVTRI